MASYSRRSRRSYGRKRHSRSGWYRRKFSRRRRYRRYRQKRRYKKMLNKKEVKFVAAQPYKWCIRPHLELIYSSDAFQSEFLRYSPAFGLGIGSGVNLPQYISWPFYSVNIEPGYLSNQRIGQKVNVLKYQVKGTFTLTMAKSGYNGNENENKAPNYTGYSVTMPSASGWIVRVLVCKCKHGEVTAPVFTQQYNDIMPTPQVLENGSQIPQGNWIRRIIPEWSMEEYQINTGDYAFTYEDIVNNTRLKTMPLQEGITNDVQILKNKTYYVTAAKPIVQFRITTKKVGIMDWPRISTKPDFMVPENVQTDTAICTFFFFAPMAYMMDNIPFMTACVKHKVFFVDP